LIDQISGSLDLKAEYDSAALALATATDQSSAQLSRRKGVNQEVKQYKEMKKEAERWTELNRKKVSKNHAREGRLAIDGWLTGVVLCRTTLSSGT
jgi:hypothetical protein